MYLQQITANKLLGSIKINSWCKKSEKDCTFRGKVEHGYNGRLWNCTNPPLIEEKQESWEIAKDIAAYSEYWILICLQKFLRQHNQENYVFLSLIKSMMLGTYNW